MLDCHRVNEQKNIPQGRSPQRRQPRVWSPAVAPGRLVNWSGNIEYSTDQLYEPRTVDKVRETVKAHRKIKALGTRHCFNKIADSRDGLLDDSNLWTNSSKLDAASKTVTVNAGITYGRSLRLRTGLAKALRCTISRRCRIFRWRAPARQEPMDRVRRMAASLPPQPDSEIGDRGWRRSCICRAPRTVTRSAAQ